MTLQAVAFTMPFVAIIFMVALVYGVSRYNRRPASHDAHPTQYSLEKSSVSWHFQGGTVHRQF